MGKNEQRATKREKKKCTKIRFIYVDALETVDVYCVEWNYLRLLIDSIQKKKRENQAPFIKYEYIVYWDIQNEIICYMLAIGWDVD